MTSAACTCVRRAPVPCCKRPGFPSAEFPPPPPSASRNQLHRCSQWTRHQVPRSQSQHSQHSRPPPRHRCRSFASLLSPHAPPQPPGFLFEPPPRCPSSFCCYNYCAPCATMVTAVETTMTATTARVMTRLVPGSARSQQRCHSAEAAARGVAPASLSLALHSPA